MVKLFSQMEMYDEAPMQAKQKALRKWSITISSSFVESHYKCDLTGTPLFDAIMQQIYTSPTRN